MLLLSFLPALILAVILFVRRDERIERSIPKTALATLLVIAILTPTPVLIAFFKWLFSGTTSK